MIKILFPTDFSNAAENAFFYALQLTRKLNAELLLAHVYELPDLGRALHNTSKEVYEIMEMETLENFKKSVETLRRKADNNGYGDIDFKHVMAEGDRKSTRLNSSHVRISYAVFCLKKKK